MSKITDKQISDLRYFWEYKGDLERYSSFEDIKEDLEKEYPEIMRAWNDYKRSIFVMDATMKMFDYQD